MSQAYTLNRGRRLVHIPAYIEYEYPATCTVEMMTDANKLKEHQIYDSIDNEIEVKKTTSGAAKFIFYFILGRSFLIMYLTRDRF